jgi:hypothetical protein
MRSRLASGPKAGGCTCLVLNGDLLRVAELQNTWLPRTVRWWDLGNLGISSGDSLTLQILSVYEGTRYEDTANSGLMFWGAHQRRTVLKQS